MTQNRKAGLVSWLQQNKLLQGDCLEPLFGDAGFRNYYRFEHLGVSCIAVDANPEQEKNHEFWHIAHAYKEGGILVPGIKAADLELGFFCLQDFGSVLLADKLAPDTVAAWYSKALAILPELQKVCRTSAGALPLYDEALIRRDFGLFQHWLLEEYLQLDLSNERQQMLAQLYQILRDNFFQQPQVGVHRDFHSRNLMLVGGEIGVIDFQDAAIGPVTYDAVSLLRDCYISWPQELILPLLQQWHQLYYSQYSWQQFKHWFDLTGIQRHLKAAGIFARLYLRDNKNTYLADIPRTLDYVIQVAQDYPQLAELAHWCKQEIQPKILRTLDGQS